MDKTRELTRILGQHLKWNKARLTCFSLMIFALLACRTICLAKMAVVLGSSAQQDSRYKRLNRFFSTFELDLTSIAHLIFQWFSTDNKEIYLVIDRTNWFFSKSKINIFMLSIAYEGQAIPLFWKLLNKAGSSRLAEQKELINRFIKTFGKQKVIGLLADREFSNSGLFKWLNKQNILFYIRIKEGSQVRIKGKNFI